MWHHLFEMRKIRGRLILSRIPADYCGEFKDF